MYFFFIYIQYMGESMNTDVRILQILAQAKAKFGQKKERMASPGLEKCILYTHIEIPFSRQDHRESVGIMPATLKKK